ncbi:MAG: putative U4/U6.U5 tri-snRNP-associated protein 2 [Streblomastix strix]|uniref:Putative U4/U6.U5 tri-snRNP-associated protein 2 n=1 Tax=Streblomastix strix TaxID=222440 RepID=A0A5J4UDY9_9EUKA|nr:MAG: putative U4/U6.U5 tri-snRNP-associated protein 2 [Streblomastix strix]
MENGFGINEDKEKKERKQQQKTIVKEKEKSQSSKEKNIIYHCFQGKLQISTDYQNRKQPLKSDQELQSSSSSSSQTSNITHTNKHFLILSLDIPPAPLFTEDSGINEENRSIIPQVPLPLLLAKYDGSTKQIGHLGEAISYRITQFPKYLILHFNRFIRNQFFVEKNPTIINFPVKGLDLSEYGLSNDRVVYDLVANIAHEGSQEEGKFTVHVLNKAQEKWYAIQDLNVEEIIAQKVVVSTAYLQIYERKI